MNTLTILIDVVACFILLISSSTSIKRNKIFKFLAILLFIINFFILNTFFE